MDFHGTPTELSNLRIDFSEFLQMKHEDNVSDDDELLHRSKTADAENLPFACEEKVAKLEDISKNKSRDSVFKTYFQSGANVYVITLILTLFILSQILASGCDFWVAFW